MRFSVHLLVAALFLVQDVVAAPVAAPNAGAVALARADDHTVKTQFSHPSAKKRVSKRTTAKAKSTAAKKTDTTAAKKTTTTTSTKKTATSCKKTRGLPRRLGRRTTTTPTIFLAKATAPDTLDITIGETAFALTKFSGSGTRDGNNGVVYQDAAKDFAKTPLNAAGDLTKEAEFTQKVGQLKAFGVDECTGTQWLVTKAASGVNFQKTTAFTTAATDADKCTEAVEAAAQLAANAAQAIFTKFGVNHGDLNPGNIFFNSAGTEVETLIDWGSATTKKFSAVFAKSQATLAFKQQIKCPSS
ncbi:APH domain-containing protein [Mycena chlorophos]|uniref:APH domain-containing protein n=1 Tax=Mycena chlorophos TaxID=658473 RepID=A0A8H6SWU2_MYCCL|nr:APH domain-containing protein [Mycena chlorophos]